MPTSRAVPVLATLIGLPLALGPLALVLLGEHLVERDPRTMPPLLALIIGLFFGAMIGVSVMAVLIEGRRRDEDAAR